MNSPPAARDPRGECLPGGGWCPHCGCPESSVVKVRTLTYTHRGQAKTKRLRRRQCVHCATRFTTREEVIGGSAAAADSGTGRDR
jgi:hypothetical protein